MDNGKLKFLLMELYNYMEDRANEETRNDEYRFLFKIYKQLKELGVRPPDDDKFNVSKKVGTEHEPMNFRAFTSDDEIFSAIDPEGKRFNMNGKSNRPELNESLDKIKSEFKRFL